MLVRGGMPDYPREALEACVEGTVMVRCVLTTEGTTTQCRVIRGLPHLDKSVLDALATHRYKPVTVKGVPVAVDYVFRFNFKVH